MNPFGVSTYEKTISPNCKKNILDHIFSPFTVHTSHKQLGIGYEPRIFSDAEFVEVFAVQKHIGKDGLIF